MPGPLRLVILKPSKYLPNGYVERFRKGFMPNSTLPHLRSLTPARLDGTPIEVHTIDEYVHTDLRYLSLLQSGSRDKALVALVGVQSHQFHRALDLAAYALENGCLAVIGGPHAMTCDTSEFWQSGTSFALAEGELVWSSILADSIRGELQPVYGEDQRWDHELDPPVVVPPDPEELRRYVLPMLGLYPARGCPFSCTFCSVIKISGHRIRAQSVATTLDSLRAAKEAGVKMIMFTSDNFNKYSRAKDLLEAMIDDNLKFKLFVQCDTQILRQPDLVDLLGQAGCFQMFVGVESFSRSTLISVQKYQNRPEVYSEIVELCAEYGVSAHLSNIIGFPEDNQNDILHQLEAVKAMEPNWASFYILCPIPGTQQYDEFLRDDLIIEQNLDRFDTTCPTWRHPKIAGAELTRLLYHCYTSFFSLRHLIRRTRHFAARQGEPLEDYLGGVGMSLFNRICAQKSMHPMSGGIGRVFLDGASDYASLRRRRYGVDRAELPRSITLPEADASFDRDAKLKVN